MPDAPWLDPNAPFRLAERRIVDHGLLTRVTILETAWAPDAEVRAQWLAQLPEAERQLARTMAAPRQTSFLAGRVALRAALAALDQSLSPHPLGQDDTGAPILPAGWHGSISHKRDAAVALVVRAEVGMPYANVGVDLERIVPRAPGAPDLARKVLTAAEREAIAHLTDDARHAEVLRRFSLKEAVYKAIAPLARRWIGFSEVDVHPHEDGTADVEHRIAEATAVGVHFEARWYRDGERLISTVRARTAPR